MLYPPSASHAFALLALSFPALSSAALGCRPLCEGGGPPCTAGFLVDRGFRSPLPPSVDADVDGIADATELELAVRLAPVVTLHRDEPSRPASVDWIGDRLAQAGRRASDFRRVSDLPREFRSGPDQGEWTTYVHVYPARSGGIIVQYWFYYPFNDGPLWFDHDSDWEHVSIQVDPSGEPLGMWAARHGHNAPGQWRAWDTLRTVDSTHAEVLAAKGTHASYFDADDASWFDVVGRCDALDGPCEHVRWRTWETRLRNLGERHAPLDAAAMGYRELWGSAGPMPGMHAPAGPSWQSGWCALGAPPCPMTTTL